jgi:hypothetical protein
VKLDPSLGVMYEHDLAVPRSIVIDGESPPFERPHPKEFHTNSCTACHPSAVRPPILYPQRKLGTLLIACHYKPPFPSVGSGLLGDLTRTDPTAPPNIEVVIPTNTHTHTHTVRGNVVQNHLAFYFPTSTA